MYNIIKLVDVEGKGKALTSQGHPLILCRWKVKYLNTSLFSGPVFDWVWYL